jgi:hypothetical protein
MVEESRADVVVVDGWKQEETTMTTDEKEAAQFGRPRQ